jgi:ABC-2 type transport system ATP-binding protein
MTGRLCITYFCILAVELQNIRIKTTGFLLENMELFKAEQITKSYSGHVALDKVSISIKKGSIFGLLGPNGAGKTTLLRIINQIIGPDSGDLFFNGRALNRNDVDKIGYLPEERGLYRKMKVGEQALYLAQLKGLSKSEAMTRLKYWFEKFEIQNWWNKKVEELSKGMQQKVQFIVTIIHEPELLIFDEPFSGFDPINVNLLTQEILNLREKGATIIFSTHNMASVEELCDDIALINKSKVILSGEVREIRQRFKPDEYEVNFTGDPERFKSSLNNLFTLQELIQDHDSHTARIKMQVGQNDNELLSLLIPAVHITSYREILPGMNDIFIRSVEMS